MAENGPGKWKDKDAFVMPVLPESLNVDPLLAALLHCMAFLELSGDDAVNPDWAVEATEHVTAYLQRLPSDRLTKIQQQLEKIAGFVAEQRGSPEFIEFTRNLLTDSGALEA